MTTPSVLLCDLDGVVLDSMRFHVLAWQEALAERGIDAPAEAIYLHEGDVENTALFRRLEGESSRRDDEFIRGVFDRQMEIFTRRYAHQVRPFPEAVSALENLKAAGMRLALVTSSARPVVDRILPTSLTTLFEQVVTGDMVSRGKPHPEPYLAAMRAMRLEDPRPAAAVENAPAGVRSALAAGLTCLALTTTLAAEWLGEAHAVFPSWLELTASLTAFQPRHSQI